jgi:NhaA family Na+:H+ antiporter
MALFFLLVGLELKREALVGELSSLKDAALPIVAAAGGMLVPALIYLSLNPESAAARGWGIPMATSRLRLAFSSCSPGGYRAH